MNLSRFVVKGSVAGVISGVILGLFFKTIEIYWNINVYTLLLNVDYIPVLNRFSFSEMVEFSFHLIISVILATILLYVAAKHQWTRRQMMVRTIGTSLFIGLVLYPTTALSERTPPLTSVSALFCWLFGHLLYGAALSLFWEKNETQAIGR
ncbi:hypothetical protein [Geobacillus sp. TFV-3]|uniref:hypothetical protein n=1 Tax=Geobacillus sp. TFV-3 TaxID=1897059 RepID=UPI0013574ABB|nr:hypothetical protein [Geobacillus sp. TFV-3]KAF0995087.1 hypothetical protein BJQ97_01739 [Geobacillus sp. TFV-3]